MSVPICSTSLTLIEDIKRFQRDRNWFLCLERYSSLRQNLISLRTAMTDLLPESEIANIQGIRRFRRQRKK